MRQTQGHFNLLAANSQTQIVFEDEPRCGFCFEAGRALEVDLCVAINVALALHAQSAQAVAEEWAEGMVGQEINAHFGVQGCG